ncbi:MAG: hypothetical protein FWC70_05615 [Defluviitaleaceae bacterium]|nr:hypothetical protein [Defluviitaleaceae bacterium]
MDRDRVKQILKFFRDIDAQIAHNAQLINIMEDTFYSLNGSGEIDGQPRAKNKISCPTEATALSVPSYASETLREWRDENEALCKLKAAISREIGRLPHLQRVIVYDFYVHGCKWQDVSQAINYTPRHCKNIRNRALDSLSRLFAGNTLIVTHKY